MQKLLRAGLLLFALLLMGMVIFLGVRRREEPIQWLAIHGENLSIMNFATGQTYQLPQTLGVFAPFTWSPTGKAVAYDFEEWGVNSICIATFPTWKSECILQNRSIAYFQPNWSPDGQWIAFIGQTDENNWAVYKVRPDGTHFENLTQDIDITHAFMLQWSPDGQWLGFICLAKDSIFRQLCLLHPDGSTLTTIADLIFMIPFLLPDILGHLMRDGLP